MPPAAFDRPGLQSRHNASKSNPGFSPGEMPFKPPSSTSPVFPPDEHHSANILPQYSALGKVSVRIALQPEDWTRC